MQQKLTPAMQQYVQMKQQYKDCILFFRMWDFYEVFWEDAKICHNLLDLVLTSKNKNSPNPIPMAWIPYHSAEKYINKLINLWYKVAIAEQTTQPKPGQIVEREVKQIITPWTYFEESSQTNNFILAISNQILWWNNIYNCARWDFSTWEYHTSSFENIEELQKKILTLNPSEIILDVNFSDKDKIHETIQNYLKCLISIYDIPHNPLNRLKNICNFQNEASFGQALKDWREEAFALLINYLKSTQKIKKININQLKYHNQKNFVLLDDTTVKNLEIFKSSYENNSKYSLFWILNNLATSAWSRLLQNILLNPLKNLNEIQQRLNFINFRYENINQAETIHYILKQTNDINKIVNFIIYKKPLPLLFVKLRKTLNILINNQQILEAINFVWWNNQDFTEIKQIYDFLESAFVDDEFINNETWFIKKWFDNQIDELSQIAYNSDSLLIWYQQELVKKTWIVNIKLKFIKNQWYFLEITNKDIDQFESFIDSNNEKFNFQRRQTLKWNQRYITTYLENLQDKIIKAKEELKQQEQNLLQQFSTYIEQKSENLFIFSKLVSFLDLYTSQAILAKQNNYCKPQFIKKWFKITAWRHPVIEKFLPIDQSFVPNDFVSNYEENNWKKTSDPVFSWEIQIITWPNMWWKSTFLRQNALILLMSHCWLFCPAKEVKTQLIDWIFARVGSWDIIAKNQSTFMTEMIEVSNILHNATQNSFVIFDELWRWTSTYDGLALTRSIIEFISQQIKCTTLIATHYHELTKLENLYPNIKNYSVSVYETDKEVIFLKKIVKWWTDKSYWIEVAKLAWIPNKILNKARVLLKQFEQKQNNIDTTKTNIWLFENTQEDFNCEKYDKIISILKSFNLNNITPLQAINLLAKLQEELKKL